MTFRKHHALGVLAYEALKTSVSSPPELAEILEARRRHLVELAKPTFSRPPGDDKCLADVLPAPACYAGAGQAVLNIRAELVSWIFDPDILIASLGNAQRVFLNIDCPGGDAHAAIKLYDALATRQVDVQVDRLAISSGAILAMAGKRRRIARNGWFLIHSPIGYISGSPACLRNAADELEKTWTRFRDILEAGTGQPRATVESWLDGDDHGFNAEDSVRFGLATEIFDPVVPVNPAK